MNADLTISTMTASLQAQLSEDLTQQMQQATGQMRYLSRQSLTFTIASASAPYAPLPLSEGATTRPAIPGRVDCVARGRRSRFSKASQAYLYPRSIARSNDFQSSMLILSVGGFST